MRVSSKQAYTYLTQPHYPDTSHMRALHGVHLSSQICLCTNPMPYRQLFRGPSQNHVWQLAVEHGVVGVTGSSVLLGRQLLS